MEKTGKKVRDNVFMLAGGALVGFLNGFFGGGGGMLCVPLLERLLKVETKRAHATAVLIILPLCLASAVVYIIGGYFELLPALTVSGGVVAGGIAGAVLLKKLNSTVVGIVFAVLMVAAGIKLMLF